MAVQYSGPTPKQAGARIELHARELADGSIKIHGSWVRRGARVKGESRYLAHIPSELLKHSMKDDERLNDYAEKRKE